jgi:branched-chain amino acid transport system substrate-binding protein
LLDNIHQVGYTDTTAFRQKQKEGEMRRMFFFAVLAVAVLGCVAQAVEPIKFGAVLPLTGWGSETGKRNLRGYQLWQEMVNEKGGILGRPVELIIYDDQSDPTLTARLYEKLITEDKVDILLAPWSDDMTMPATTVAEKYKKPIVTGGATLDLIWERGYKYVCGVLPSSYDYVGVPIRYIVSLGGISSGAVIACNLTFTQGFAVATVKNFEELGIKTVLNETYPAGTKNFVPILLKLKASNPDLVVVCGTLEEHVEFMRQCKQMDVNPKAFYLTVSVTEPEFVELLGPDAEYVFGTSEWEPTLQSLPGFEEFYHRYMAKYGEEPAEDDATGFAVAQILQHAIELAGCLDDEKINEVLHTMEFTTVFGTYKVDPNTGRQIGKELFVIQIQNGKREIVWPPEYATATVRFPTPAWKER